MNTERIVIVGASLAGLRAAEALRAEGFTGGLTLIGDEPHPPYDRPPLSKAVLSGRLSAEHTGLPHIRPLDAQWLLGVAATGLDRHHRQVMLADGRRVGFDKLLIATGTWARPWPATAGTARYGVHPLRSREDATKLRCALEARPRRVLVIGGGFTGSEVASSCRDLGLPVTLTHRGSAPLSGALGATVARFTIDLQRNAGVDLRVNTTVQALDADETGHLRRARLSDGTILHADIAVVALGAVSNIDWLAGSGLLADHNGVRCDVFCRVLATGEQVAEGIYAAGDVAQWPHPRYDNRLVRLDHWGNAVEQARVAAHNMVHDSGTLRAHDQLPSFWSNQFGVNVKTVGLPTAADEVLITQGSPAARKFVAAYGRQGRIVAAVAVDSPRILEGYSALIGARTEFPPVLNATDAPADLAPLPAGFSHQAPAPISAQH